MKQVFTKILGIDIGFTTKVEGFIKHTGAKITYTRQPLQNEFFVRSNDLLFEQGINDIQIYIIDWDNVPCFFPTAERSNAPYDIFAASFYLLSRYEEYLPHVKDIHGRFSPKDSLAYQNGFLSNPVVDIWAFKFLKLLLERFPDLAFRNRKYKYESIIEVTTSHCYANRGLMRGAAGLLLDIGTFRLKRVIERIAVIFKIRKDPYDNFSELIAWHKEFKVKSIFFFQFANYSKYDKNVSTNNNNFKSLIKYIGDYSKVALAGSYSSFANTDVLLTEKQDLANVVNRPVDFSRMRYNRVDIPDTYRNLVEAEFTDDFTMGYSREIGFRAGTCSAFQFYDIPLEVQQPIKIHPFAIHDYALMSLKNKKEIVKVIKDIYEEVKYVNGTLVTVFSNELLGNLENHNWKEIYKDILKNYNV